VREERLLVVTVKLHQISMSRNIIREGKVCLRSIDLCRIKLASQILKCKSKKKLPLSIAAMIKSKSRINHEKTK